MCYYVYILYSDSCDTFYKGQTKDLADRLKRHNQKQEKATHDGVPWIIIWSVKKQSRALAINLERKLKNLSRKRTIDFILKYKEGVAGPDEFLLVDKLSGC